MRDHLLACLQLQTFSPFPKTNKSVYRCRSVSLFFDVYCTCREAYFPDDIKSDGRHFMVNCNICGVWYHEKCMNIPVKVFRDEKYYHAVEMLCLQKIRYMKNLDIFFAFIGSPLGCCLYG